MKAFGYMAHTVFEVLVDSKVQEELGLSDNDVQRLLGDRSRYVKGWTEPSKGYPKKSDLVKQAKEKLQPEKAKKRPQATVSKSEDEVLF